MRDFFWGKARVLFGAAVTLGLGACARYALPISDAQPLAPVVLRVPLDFETVRAKVLGYLVARNRFGTVFIPAGTSAEVRYNQPWVRDTSLRYYALEFERRARHIVEWKGQWIVRELAPKVTELRLNVLETLFLGPPQLAGAGPTLNNDWFETEPDGLRAGLELRRFWLESFATLPLPPPIANLNVPSLQAEPASKARLAPRWTPATRRRPF